MFSDNRAQKREFFEFLYILKDLNVLPHVMICGSWAEYLYEEGNVLENFISSLKTKDIDFLIKNINRPADPVNLSSYVAENGYITDVDPLLGTTKFYSPSRLEIEFLALQKGSGINSVLPTSIGVKAQALRHMDILLRHSMTVNIYDLNIQIPIPEAYIIHKMIINNKRKPNKQEKDMNSVIRLLPFINYQKFNDVYWDCTKKEQNSLLNCIEKYKDDIRLDCSLDVVLKLYNIGLAKEKNIKEKYIQQENDGLNR